MRKLMWAAVVILVMASGCSQSQSVAPAESATEPGRIFCDGCKAIRALQAKSSRSLQEDLELERMIKIQADLVRGLASANEAKGEPAVELHPGCDCPCHFAVR